MTWIEPLELETWMINVFAGNPDVFGAIALLVISSMAAYFRMNPIAMFLMLFIFVMMFTNYVGFSFLLLFGLIGGLIAGYVLSKLLE